MDELKYPIGIQTFSEIIEEGYAYVDKTAFIGKLIKSKYVFLSRPRRFGKSLFISTLQAYFEGRRELFKGLALDAMDIDWTPSPVLRFDFNSEDYTNEEGLHILLDRSLSSYEKKYGIIEKENSLSGRFSKLIETACETAGNRVVILIDEYDKPLLDLDMDTDSDLYKSRQGILKGFFGNLKSMDQYIRFGFLSGVARFGKVSIFSDLNNLKDISLSNDFADICGWTEKELTDNFHKGIERLAEEIEESFDSTADTLREYYDGYKFAAKGSRLYNPFSVLMALDSREIEPYWYETATPTFLARRVKAFGINPGVLNFTARDRESLQSLKFDTLDPVPLMFQTGYLTIRNYDKRLKRFDLCFPNKEVEIGFAKNLIPLYVPGARISESPYSIDKFKRDLYDGNPDEFMKRLQSLVKSLPYSNHGETFYQSIVWLICTLSGEDSEMERQSYRGRSDLEVITRDYIYIFEFKFNGSEQEAMAQILERDYAGRFAMDTRPIFLIGANFSDDKNARGLTDYSIKKIDKTPD